MEAQRERHASQVGVQYLLFDKQENFETAETYIHYAKRVLEGGLEECSEIEVEFDPAYEHLAFHRLNIFRNGKLVENPFALETHLLQKEESLPQHIYQGHLSLLFLLHDVRKDDIIEVAFTLSGKNPILQNHYCNDLNLSYPTQIEHIHYRCLRDKNRPFYLKLHNTELEVEENLLDNSLIETILSLSPGFVHEVSMTPDWYLPIPWLQISSFGSWKEVSSWGKSLFETSEENPIQELIALWSSSGSSKEELALKALTFVQEEIRYLGSEVGIYSYQPYSPQEILTRRFGDCKDKTLLLKCFMDNIGIPATPCLVHSSLQQTVADFHPSPAAFNHAVLKVALEGEEILLDPTQKFQGGSLRERAQKEYTCYLPLDESDLNFCLPDATERGAVAIERHYSVCTNSPSELTITSSYTGQEADYHRALINYQGKENLQEKTRSFYGSLYGKADVKEPLEVEDNLNDNQIKTTQSFELQDLLAIDSENQLASFTYEPLAIISSLPQQVEITRSDPLAILHPANIQETIRITSEVPFNDACDFVTVEHPAFIFHCDTYSDSKELIIRYSYQSLSDHIDPKDLKQLRESLQKIEGQVYRSYLIPLTTQTVHDLNDAYAYGGLIIFALGLCIMSYFMWRRSGLIVANIKQKWKKAFWIFYCTQFLLVSLIGIFSIKPTDLSLLFLIYLPSLLWAFFLYYRSYKHSGTILLGTSCYLLVFSLPNPIGIYFLIRCIQLFRYNRNLRLQRKISV